MKTLIKIIVPVLLVVLAYLGAKQMIASKPELQSQQPAAIIPKVSTIQVSPDRHSPPIKSFGTVQSYFETTLTPQVAGSITQVSPLFRVGQLVKKGDILATLDNSDYLATLARESANLANNQRQLAEEMIRAKQAKSDWKASGRALESASSFVLRTPQLTAAKANVASSEATLKKAQIDIDRCSITAPFDSIVTERNASVGNFANQQSPLGRLIATEKAEIRLPLTPEQTARIQLPSKDNSTEINLTSPTVANKTWTAVLKRTEPVIDPQNQVLYVIAEIDYPYGSDSPLSVGTFVNASIPSIPLEKCLEIPEEALVNDSYLWAISASEALEKVEATRLYSYEGKAYVQLTKTELQEPFTVVSRPLSNFRPEMKVSIDSPSK